MPDAQWRSWKPYISPQDPCLPIYEKWYIVSPNEYVTFQPAGWQQFSLNAALKRGTLWTPLYSPYVPPKVTQGGGVYG